MAKRKERVLVLLDTNIFVRGHQSKHVTSPIYRVWKLWLARRIQIAISLETAQEYQEILERIGVDPQLVETFLESLQERPTVTWVRLGRRLRFQRDPDDEAILSTAQSANVKFLITLDGDMLEMPLQERRRFTFEIVTPIQFLEGFVLQN